MFQHGLVGVVGRGNNVLSVSFCTCYFMSHLVHVVFQHGLVEGWGGGAITSCRPLSVRATSCLISVMSCFNMGWWRGGGRGNNVLSASFCTCYFLSHLVHVVFQNGLVGGWVGGAITSCRPLSVRVTSCLISFMLCSKMGWWGVGGQ